MVRVRIQLEACEKIANDVRYVYCGFSNIHISPGHFSWQEKVKINASKIDFRYTDVLSNIDFLSISKTNGPLSIPPVLQCETMVNETTLIV